MAVWIFGELRQDKYGWYGKRLLDFGGKPQAVELLIHRLSGQNEITPRQEEAFRCFMEKWPDLQDSLTDELIKFYNENERFAWGPDDEEELAQWWPEINTREALLQAVDLETIVVGWDFQMKRGRYIYLLFARSWGGEDLDDNGIGVRFVNEEIEEVAYKDMAF